MYVESWCDISSSNTKRTQNQANSRVSAFSHDTQQPLQDAHDSHVAHYVGVYETRFTIIFELLVGSTSSSLPEEGSGWGLRCPRIAQFMSADGYLFYFMRTCSRSGEEEFTAPDLCDAMDQVTYMRYSLWYGRYSTCYTSRVTIFAYLPK